MEFFGEIFAIGSVLIAMILVARFNVGLLLNTEELTKIIAAVGAMIAGAFVGRALFAKVIFNSSDMLFNCTPMAGLKYFYNCGGWPVLGDSARGFVIEVFSVTTNAALVTPLFASFIGALYIQRQLVSNWDFDWKDAAQVFFAGFMLMISIVLIPKIAVSMSELLLEAGNYASLVERGQANLASLIQLIQVASEAAEQESLSFWMDAKVFILRLTVFGLSSIINYVGPCFILVQAVIFFSAPVALLSAVLTESQAKEKAFDVGLAYAKFTFIQVIYWTMFTLAPKVDESATLESLDLGIAGQALGLASLILILSVVLLLVSAKFIAIPLLLSTARRMT